MSLRFAITPLVSVGLAAVLLVACNSTRVLDNDPLQQMIQDGLANNAGITATVTCPDNRPIQQGDVFDCQALTPDGLTLTIQVTQTDNAGHVDWQIVGR
jgi:hypothetical protein